ncbi:CD151 antigen [Anoplophora glabripennis]|uniref:CD151 antigen n=1 Tax=Anoplophora glabripennis TaxID=217634 RepID=UPI000873783C|nr:CD151 antigen [Anoplophora glabripennis]XP_018579463.1 CD151 antigen [Anoplophora glabripennis]
MGWGGQKDGCGNFMKYSLFVVNLIIFLGGVIVVALGIWTVVDKSFANDLLGTNLYAGAVYVLIATGLLVVLISCLGCLGSVKEVRCMLVIYFISLFLIFVTMLVGGILGYVFRGKVETTLRIGMEGSLRDYGNYKPITEAWDITQTRLECCGIYSHKDWQNRLPESCCKLTRTGERLKCQSLVENNSFTMNTRGCLNVTTEFVKTHAVVIGTSGIVLSLIMIFGMIFSCALFKLIE